MYEAWKVERQGQKFQVFAGISGMKFKVTVGNKCVQFSIPAMPDEFLSELEQTFNGSEFSEFYQYDLDSLVFQGFFQKVKDSDWLLLAMEDLYDEDREAMGYLRLPIKMAEARQLHRLVKGFWTMSLVGSTLVIEPGDIQADSIVDGSGDQSNKSEGRVEISRERSQPGEKEWEMLTFKTSFALTQDSADPFYVSAEAKEFTRHLRTLKEVNDLDISPEGFIFCVRHHCSRDQLENLAQTIMGYIRQVYNKPDLRETVQF